MLPSVKIEDIEAAIKIAEHRHFTRAGQELNRHQTAVSRSAERVESGIGVELFDRTSHPIRLTKAGVAFFYWVRKGMDAFERAIVEGLRASQPEASVLQVGFTSYLDLDVLAYLENVAKAPGAGFSHKDHSSSSSETIASVLSGKWDCGFIVSPATTGGLVGVPVYRDPFGLALASDHPLARRRKVSVADLRDMPLIVPARERNTGFRAWFIERCGASGVKPKIAQEVGNPNEAWFMVSQHAGAALMPRAATQNLAKCVCLLDLAPFDGLIWPHPWFVFGHSVLGLA